MYQTPTTQYFLPYSQPVATSIQASGLNWVAGAHGYPAVAPAAAGRSTTTSKNVAQSSLRSTSHASVLPLRRSPSTSSLSQTSVTGSSKHVVKTPHQVLVVFQDSNAKKNRQHQIVRVSKKEDLLPVIESHPCATGRKVDKICVATWSGQETFPLDTSTWADVCQGSRLIKAYLSPTPDSPTTAAPTPRLTPPLSNSLASLDQPASKHLNEAIPNATHPSTTPPLPPAPRATPTARPVTSAVPPAWAAVATSPTFVTIPKAELQSPPTANSSTVCNRDSADPIQISSARAENHQHLDKAAPQPQPCFMPARGTAAEVPNPPPIPMEAPAIRSRSSPTIQSVARDNSPTLALSHAMPASPESRQGKALRHPSPSVSENGSLASNSSMGNSVFSMPRPPSPTANDIHGPLHPRHRDGRVLAAKRSGILSHTGRPGTRHPQSKNSSSVASAAITATPGVGRRLGNSHPPKGAKQAPILYNPDRGDFTEFPQMLRLAPPMSTPASQPTAEATAMPEAFRVAAQARLSGIQLELPSEVIHLQQMVRDLQQRILVQEQEFEESISERDLRVAELEAALASSTTCFSDEVSGKQSQFVPTESMQVHILNPSEICKQCDAIAATLLQVMHHSESLRDAVEAGAHALRLKETILQGRAVNGGPEAETLWATMQMFLPPPNFHAPDGGSNNPVDIVRRRDLLHQLCTTCVDSAYYRGLTDHLGPPR